LARFGRRLYDDAMFLCHHDTPIQIFGARPARSNTGVFSISPGPAPDGVSSAA
jgi:hypothetical protein